MSDQREKKLAELLVRYSVALKKGEKCLINAVDVPVSMTEALIDAVYQAGAYPLVNLWSERIERAMTKGASVESLHAWAEPDVYRMKEMDAFIGIRGIANVRELASLPEQAALVSSLYNKPVHMEVRVPHTRWVVLRYPTECFALQAGMATVDFEDYFYDVCINVDYPAMRRAMEEAKQYLDTVDKVHIIGKGTDLSFSVKGMPWIPCAGEANIPDGEIYSCPVKNSVNGKITYNCRSTYQGHCFSDVSLTFKDGKIVEAHADDDVLVNKVFDTDAGARYVGEFSLGCNPRVTVPIDNILFDEKIKSSIHFTPGQSYRDCYNGNDSAVHWDLVQIQRKGYAEARIYFDDVLVRENGVFVHPALKGLNFNA